MTRKLFGGLLCELKRDIVFAHDIVFAQEMVAWTIVVVIEAVKSNWILELFGK